MKHDMPTCGGCRTCEIACSFHHTEAYNPSVSSIRILEKEKEAGYVVLLLEDSAEGFACDKCRDLEVPWCVKVCREKDDLAVILDKLTPSGESGS